MEVKKTLKTLLKEASIYQTQGLLADARKKYETAITLIEETVELPNRDELLSGVKRKIVSLEKVVYRVEKRTVTPEISSTDKELIKKLFAVSETHDPDDAAIEGAMALAKFGLFERAIQEFEMLLDRPGRRMEVAKHILRCHMAIRSAHDPMMQYKKWSGDSHFPEDELKQLKVFLEKTYGMASAPPATEFQDPVAPTVGAPVPPQPPPPPPAEVAEYDPYEDSYEDVLAMLPKTAPTEFSAGDESSDVDYSEVIDSFVPVKKKKEVVLPDENSIEEYIDYISSIGIPVSMGPRKGQVIDLPVNLQTSDMINLIIPAAHKDLIAMLRKGATIEALSLNSPIMTNTGTGTVLAAAVIDQGLRQGDCSVDLKID